VELKHGVVLKHSVQMHVRVYENPLELVLKQFKRVSLGFVLGASDSIYD
jgi:hypothetical protein